MSRCCAFYAALQRMPELPEVETCRRGISPWLEGRTVEEVIVRERKLRWPVPVTIDRNLPGATFAPVRRRAKYLLLDTDKGSAMLHLGMSGTLRIIDQDEPAGKHDHVDITLDSGKALRFRDPRRFGSLLWSNCPDEHALIRDLGPEPLGDLFSGQLMWEKSRGRKVAIKQFIMNANVVVGVGNIYASEALYQAQIHPRRAAGRVSAARLDALAAAIKSVLTRAIQAGGTTLRDFHGGNGESGYFQQQLDVYGRDGKPCRRCTTPLRSIVLGQRSSFYCPACQR